MYDAFINLNAFYKSDLIGNKTESFCHTNKKKINSSKKKIIYYY